MSLKIITIGALTQAPRHSTSSHDSVPLGIGVELVVMDLAAADIHQLFRAAQHAGRRAADLDMGAVPTGFSWNCV